MRIAPGGPTGEDDAHLRGAEIQRRRVRRQLRPRVSPSGTQPATRQPADNFTFRRPELVRRRGRRMPRPARRGRSSGSVHLRQVPGDRDRRPNAWLDRMCSPMPCRKENWPRGPEPHAQSPRPAGGRLHREPPRRRGVLSWWVPAPWSAFTCAGGISGCPPRACRWRASRPRWVGFNIAGPASQKRCSHASPMDDVSGDAFPFLTARRMEVGPVREAVVLRISFTGELGYEMFFPPEYQRPLLAAIEAAGEDLDLQAGGQPGAGVHCASRRAFPAGAPSCHRTTRPTTPASDRFVKLG